MSLLLLLRLTHSSALRAAPLLIERAIWNARTRRFSDAVMLFVRALLLQTADVLALPARARRG